MTPRRSRTTVAIATELEGGGRRVKHFLNKKSREARVWCGARKLDHRLWSATRVYAHEHCTLALTAAVMFHCLLANSTIRFKNSTVAVLRSALLSYKQPLQCGEPFFVGIEPTMLLLIIALLKENSIALHNSAVTLPLMQPPGRQRGHCHPRVSTVRILTHVLVPQTCTSSHKNRIKSGKPIGLRTGFVHYEDHLAYRSRIMSWSKHHPKTTCG